MLDNRGFPANHSSWSNQGRQMTDETTLIRSFCGILITVPHDVAPSTGTNENQHKRTCAAYRSPMPWGRRRRLLARRAPSHPSIIPPFHHSNLLFSSVIPERSSDTLSSCFRLDSCKRSIRSHQNRSHFSFSTGLKFEFLTASNCCL
jgi:hypothetical protein